MKFMKRTDSLNVLMLGVFAGCAGNSFPASSGAFPAVSGPERRAAPNVLFIIADDLNDSIQGMGGHPQTLTPNITRFMQSAVWFSNAQCNAPLCGPSRASLLTGLYPHTLGYYGWGQNPAGQKNHKETFQRPVIKDCTTFIQEFAQNGYTVFGTGKITHEYHRDAWLFDNADGKRRYAFSPVTQGPGASDGLVMSNGLLRGVKAPEYTPAPLAKEGRYFGPLSRVPDVPPNPKTGAPGYRGWMEWGQPFRYESETDRDLMADEKSARFAVDVLKQKHEQPFLLAVGFCRPHEPLVCPQKYFDLFKDVQIELPPYLENDLADCAKALYGNSVGEKIFEALKESGPGMWQEWMRAYLACVAFMDDQFGQIIRTLDSSPYATNTIVIFTGDNGFHMGEKNMINKMTLWNESTRVPFLIRVPGMQTGGQNCFRPVSLIDIYPTLTDYCGMPVPKQGLDGHSLRPFIKNPQSGHWTGPDVALTVWMGPPTAAQRADCSVPANKELQNFSAVSDRYRYIRAYTGEEEFYDHSADPNEWHNLAGNPEYKTVLEEMKFRMDQLLSSGTQKTQ